MQGLKAAGASPETDVATCIDSAQTTGGLPGHGLGASEILPVLHDVPENVWIRVEAQYKLPETSLLGLPRHWQQIGVTSNGHPAYRGVNLPAFLPAALFYLSPAQTLLAVTCRLLNLS